MLMTLSSPENSQCREVLSSTFKQVLILFIPAFLKLTHLQPHFPFSAKPINNPGWLPRFGPRATIYLWL